MIKELKSELKEYENEKYVESVLKDMTEEDLYPNFITAYEEAELRNPEWILRDESVCRNSLRETIRIQWENRFVRWEERFLSYLQLP